MSQPTLRPDPWHYGQEGDCPTWVVQDKDGKVVAVTFDEPHARAVAAVPSLLTAGVEAWANLVVAVDAHRQPCDCAACHAIGQLRQALSDATAGAQPRIPAHLLDRPPEAEPEHEPTPKTLAQVVAALPPGIGRLLTELVGSKARREQEARLAAAEAAVAHWTALCACIREELGAGELGAELLAAAKLGPIPEGWTAGVESYRLRIELPGLCPLLLDYSYEDPASGGWLGRGDERILVQTHASGSVVIAQGLNDVLLAAWEHAADYYESLEMPF